MVTVIIIELMFSGMKNNSCEDPRGEENGKPPSLRTNFQIDVKSRHIRKMEENCTNFPSQNI